MDAEGSCSFVTSILTTGGHTGHAWGSEQRQEEAAGVPGWLQSWVLRRHLSLDTAFPWGEDPCPFQLALVLDILQGSFLLRSPPPRAA